MLNGATPVSTTAPRLQVTLRRVTLLLLVDDFRLMLYLLPVLSTVDGMMPDFASGQQVDDQCYAASNRSTAAAMRNRRWSLPLRAISIRPVGSPPSRGIGKDMAQRSKKFTT